MKVQYFHGIKTGKWEHGWMFAQHGYDKKNRGSMDFKRKKIVRYEYEYFPVNENKPLAGTNEYVVKFADAWEYREI